MLRFDYGTGLDGRRRSLIPGPSPGARGEKCTHHHKRLIVWSLSWIPMLKWGNFAKITDPAHLDRSRNGRIGSYRSNRLDDGPISYHSH
jgi:hypothetical protein